MITRAIAKYIRISPRKARQIIDLIRGKNVNEALAILPNINKRASSYVGDVLKSAISNAQKKSTVDVNNLYISKIIADDGPMLKRYKAAAMGRATMIRRRMSHITVELDVRRK